MQFFEIEVQTLQEIKQRCEHEEMAISRRAREVVAIRCSSEILPWEVKRVCKIFDSLEYIFWD